jgi:hypothetical protein
MKFRVLFIAVALIALTNLAFSQATVQWQYVPPSGAPLTDVECTPETGQWFVSR